MTKRIYNGKWDPDEVYDATIEDDYECSLNIDGIDYEFILVDTAGDSVYPWWFREATAFILVYKITSIETFNRIKDYHKTLRRLAEDSHMKPMILVGNKLDLETNKDDGGSYGVWTNDQRAVPKDFGQILGDEWKIPFIETSAKENINIDEMMGLLVREITQFVKREKEERLKEKDIKRKQRKSMYSFTINCAVLCLMIVIIIVAIVLITD